jgi:hypothetical protein
MGDKDRAIALSQQFIQTHRVLRGRLAVLRDQLVASASDGPTTAGPAGGRGPANPLVQDLLTYCLAFCGVMHIHHSSEDNQLLPELRAAQPALSAALDSIVQDHILVASLLRRIVEVCSPDNRAPIEKVVRELDGLAAILESHFTFEEQRIGAALDALGPGEWTAGVFAVADSGGPLSRSDPPHPR